MEKEIKGNQERGKADTVASISAYLQQLIGEKLDKPASSIEITAGFFELGLDSKMTMELVRTLEGKLGHELYPTLLFEYQNIKDLSAYFQENEKGFFDDPIPAEAKIEASPQMPAVANEKEVVAKSNSVVELHQSCWMDQPKTVAKKVEPEAEQLIVLANGSASLSSRLNELTGQEVLSVISKNEESFFNQILTAVQSKLALKKTIGLTLVYRNSNYLDHRFINGLLKTATLEAPRFKSKILGVDSLSLKKIDELAQMLQNEQGSKEADIRYLNGKRQVRRTEMISDKINQRKAIQLKEGGVYLITGGAGGLGALFGNHISQTKNTKLILTGRSKKCRLSKTTLEEMNATYISCDILKTKSVKELIATILHTHGQLDGIIHSAGIIKDSILIKKTPKSAKKVLLTKIRGAKNLDQFTKNVELDFMVFFSSISSVAGNVGQGDYAAANAWLNDFATHRNYLQAAGKRKGKTISINWPLWENGGMDIDDEKKKYLKEKTAFDLLPTEKGIKAFDQLLNLNLDQVIVLCKAVQNESEKTTHSETYADAVEMLEETEVDIWGDDFSVMDEPAKTNKTTEESVAIIGLSGRYPGAKNMDEFWTNLSEGKDCISEIPKERWDVEQFYDSEKGKMGKTYSRWGGFLDEVDKFDPLFFHMSPRSAQDIDPQARLFIEEAWNTFEDAGYNLVKLAEDNKVGVFAGAFWTDYQLFRPGNDQSAPSSFVSLVANFTSYYLGLRGPSIGLDTQCSSSLTALHLACESIRNGESDLAIAGGVNLSLHPSKYLWLANARFLSDKGRCESFGEGGEGYVPAEGVGTILIKRLSQAIQDGDRIYGVIKGSAINHGGRSSGFTVPNPNAQAEVILEAMKRAGVRAEDFGYIEAHGTGTSLGDPIEMAGLHKAFKNSNRTGQYCALGSVKSNIGHAEAAAGISGVSKILLQLKHKKIVPSLHSATLNKKIDFEKTAFKVPQELTKWTALNDRPRLAGISSFGAGGSNAHIVIEEYTAEIPAYEASHPAIILLSARNAERLDEQVANLLDFLKKKEVENIYNIAYTLQVGRESMEERLAMIVNDTDDLVQQLSDFQEGRKETVFIGNIKKDKNDFLLAGDAGLAYIQTAIQKQQSEALAQLWVKGVEIDWGLLYKQGERPSKISLPTYPFAKQRCWSKMSDEIRSARLNTSPQTLAVAGHPPQSAPAKIQLLTEDSIGDSEVKKATKIQLVVLDELGATAEMPAVPDQPKAEPVVNTSQPVVVPEKEISTAQETKAKNVKKQSKKEVENELLEMLSDALYIDKKDLNTDEKFVDLGMDSIIGVELIKSINDHFLIKLEATELYNYPTIALLLDYVYDQIIELADEETEEEEVVVSPVVKTVSEPTPVKSFSDTVASDEGLEGLLFEDEPIKQKEIGTVKKEGAINIATTDIALIGMSGKFPQSPDVESFWEHLKKGNGLVTEVPSDKWDKDIYFSEDREAEGKSYSKWMGSLSDSDCFDPLFFNISPTEAELMDPQQRLFLEESWKAIEDAGYAPKSLSEKMCGVFIGVGAGDYGRDLEHSQRALNAYDLTGNSSAILSARISYFLNLKGPALSIDTACSSSLVAIAQGCDSIVLGTCDMALAGGVCILASHQIHVTASKAGMLSPDGECHAFDQSANGFVPGESVGIVMLKRLDKAIEDNDQIYGVIKGWGVNQDGSTNGITAPSSQSQTQLQTSIYDRFGINPETISYIEAHGTGTKLGDPIEIIALKETFKKYTEKTNYCGIGSVKSNIGHTMTAAGVSGLIKVLLQLKHKQLVPTVNFRTLNEHIKLADSPFYINAELKDWEQRGEQARRAAISSFGFSGTNAHLVVEEYTQNRKVIHSDDPVIVLLSAKNKERLKEQVSNLANFLCDDIQLVDLAYTLQLGRDSMEERLAFVVNDFPSLKEQLNQFLNGETKNVFSGNVKDHKSDFILSGPAAQDYIQSAIANKQRDALAQLWAKGVTIDWNLLYDKNQKPRRISLPTYPFARDRYWLPKVENPVPLISNHQLHPLLHSNESDMSEQKYLSVFTGSELFLSDHKVGGEKVFPGVAYLELAREAGRRSLHEPIYQLKDINWSKPIKVNGQPEQVQINLFREEGAIAYEVYRLTTNKSNGQVYAQGKLSTEKLEQPNPRNIDAIKDRIGHHISGRDCYESFRQAGLTYGSSFQGIKELFFDEKEALSKIDLPKNIAYVLQPGIMDSALQTCIGISFGEQEKMMALPYSINEVNIYGDVSKTAWSHVRKIEPATEAATTKHYDIDMLSDTGEVLLSFKNFAVVPIRAAVQSKQALSQTDDQTKVSSSESDKEELYFQTVWKRLAFSETNQSASRMDNQVLILGRENPFVNQLKMALEASGNQVLISEQADSVPLAEVGSVYLLQGLYEASLQNDIEDQLDDQEYAVFNWIKKLQSHGRASLNLTILTNKTQLVHPSDIVSETGAGIIGLMGSVAKEQPKWNVRVLDIDRFNQTTIDKILAVPFSKTGTLTALRDQQFYQARLVPSNSLSSLPAESKFKESGVYVILGGAGGLGSVTTEYLIKNFKAQVYWLGRRKVNEEIESKILKLSQYGPAPVYIECDATDRLSVESAYREIKLKEREINGLFHSAIVLHDRPLAEMELSDFKKAFEPKSLSSRYLAEIFREEEMDFICFYSSTQSYINAPKQANYSAGCTYKDSYARKLEQELGIACYTVNWGYWGDVGVVSSNEYNERMSQMGIGSITPAEGMKALEILLAGTNRQLSVIKFSVDSGVRNLPVFDWNKKMIHQEKVSSIQLTKISLQI